MTMEKDLLTPEVPTDHTLEIKCTPDDATNAFMTLLYQAMKKNAEDRWVLNRSSGMSPALDGINTDKVEGLTNALREKAEYGYRRIDKAARAMKRLNYDPLRNGGMHTPDLLAAEIVVSMAYDEYLGALNLELSDNPGFVKFLEQALNMTGLSDDENYVDEVQGELESHQRGQRRLIGQSMHFLRLLRQQGLGI